MGETAHTPPPYPKYLYSCHGRVSAFQNAAFHAWGAGLSKPTPRASEWHPEQMLPTLLPLESKAGRPDVIGMAFDILECLKDHRLSNPKLWLNCHLSDMLSTHEEKQPFQLVLNRRRFKPKHFGVLQSTQQYS